MQGLPDTLDPDDFILESRLGEGSYGEVYRARDKRTDTLVAVKIVPVETDLDDLLKEINVLQGCHSEYIVGYFGSYTGANELYVRNYKKMHTQPLCYAFVFERVWMNSALGRIDQQSSAVMWKRGRPPFHCSNNHPFSLACGGALIVPRFMFVR